MADRPGAQAISRANPGWRHEFEETLPDLKDEDIAGSGFAIQNYTVHRDLGGDAALARLRQRLQERGLKLMLDFVPNHMAPDHPWVEEHPDYFVAGTEELLAQEPQNYVRVVREDGDLILAYGRDPILRRLAGYVADRLQQSRRARSDDPGTRADRKPVRRRALRHGDAAAARGLRAHVGQEAGTLLASSHPACASKTRTSV